MMRFQLSGLLWATAYSLYAARDLLVVVHPRPDEIPVRFKWCVVGLYDGSHEFCGEECAEKTFLRLDGALWTTNKDGISSALLAAEITARMSNAPGNGAAIEGIKVAAASMPSAGGGR